MMQTSLLDGKIALEKIKTERAGKVGEMSKAMDDLDDTEADSRCGAGTCKFVDRLNIYMKFCHADTTSTCNST